MKKILSFVLCLAILVPCCLSIFAENALTVTTTVPQVKASCDNGESKGYKVYVDGERVDDKEYFMMDKNAPFKITVVPDEGKYIIHSYFNDVHIFTKNGQDFYVNTQKEENTFKFETADVEDKEFEGVFETNTKYRASLTLNNNIDINFAIRKLCSSFDLDKLTLTVDGTERDLPEEVIVNGDLEYLLASQVSYEMGKKLHCVLTYNGDEVITFDYSVATYCNAVLNPKNGYKTSYPALYNLCKAVLNYGERSQTFFEKEDLIDLDEDYRLDFSANSYKVPKPENTGYKASDDFSKVGANLTLGSNISLNFHFSSILNLTKDDIVIKNQAGVEVEKDNVEFENDGGEYTVRIKNIGASKLSRTYTLTIDGMDEAEFYISYGVYDYCYGAEGESDEALKMLCRAIYRYGQAARAY